ncbi:MAG: hypothetical protein QM784_20555 [Polyangiaceae bacterium]
MKPVVATFGAVLSILRAAIFENVALKAFSLVFAISLFALLRGNRNGSNGPSPLPSS